MVQASNIWPRHQVVCMNDERLRQELGGDDPAKQIVTLNGNNYSQVRSQLFKI